MVAFREEVKRVVEGLITGPMPEPASSPVDAASPWWALFLAFEHEKIHLETSSVIMRQLPIGMLAPPPGWRTAPTYDSAPTPAAAGQPPPPLLALPPTTVTLGKPRDFPSFGWDNEYGSRAVAVPAFAASAALVSNGEYLPFVEAGGYLEDAWWIGADGDDEGLRWKRYRAARHPSFWVASSHPDMARFVSGSPSHAYQCEDGSAAHGARGARAWSLRAQFSIIPMPWDWPVEVNFLEAAAFLRWKAAQEGGGVAYRVPTEAEYHVLRGGSSSSSSSGSSGAAEVGKDGAALAARAAFPMSPSAAAAAAGEAGRADIVMRASPPGNTNWRYGSPSPVTLFPPSPAGAYDTAGNVWEWVADHFAPLPGFEIHYLYDDFSSPCFDGWHTMILGGSWVSSGNLASSFARYHFRRHFFQHLGFRYVRLEAAAAAKEAFPGQATVANLWEGATGLSAELTSAYAPPSDRLPPAFPLHSASLLAGADYPAQLARVAWEAYAAALASIPEAAAAAAAAAAPEAAAAAAALPTVLHLGCGVGAGTFALCRHFERVLGVDAREPSIRQARILQHHGQYEYERVREGLLTRPQLARVPEGVDRSRAHFVVSELGVGSAAAAAAPPPGDAAGEVAAAGPFPVVVYDSLLTGARNPREALAAVTSLVCREGLLLISSSNAWSAAATPRNSWLGGFKMNGEDQATLSQLQYALKAQFELLHTLDLPRALQEGERRVVLDIQQVTVWRRRAVPGEAEVRGFRRVI